MSDEDWSIVPDVETEIDFSIYSKRKITENVEEESPKKKKTEEDKTKEEENVEIVPTHESFYIVKLVRETDGLTKYYVAQNNALNNIGNLFWMNFMRKLDGSKFSWMNSDGLVSSNEIVKTLSKPSQTSQSSTRRGNCLFSLDEMIDFVLE